MKPNIKSKLVFGILMALLAGAPSNAQDLTRLLYAHSDTSIVRHYGEDSMLCYNYGVSKGNTFFKVGVSGSMSPFLRLRDDSIRIMDFEIFMDVVYFCGLKKINKNNSYAVMGFFRMADFQNAIVKYDVFDGLLSFNKLDVFTAEGQVHVVMTATGVLEDSVVSRYSSTIVDARENSDGSWIYCILDNAKDKYHFYDVAVTDTKVVFTAKALREDFPDYFDATELWCFDKPVLYGMPVFLTNMTMGCLYNWPEGNIPIEYMYENYFVIAYTRDGGVAASLFNGLNYIRTCKVQFGENDKPRDVLDIKYNRTSDRSDILTRAAKEDPWNGKIFTIPHANYYYPGAVPERTIVGHDVMSLDMVVPAADNYVASGYDTASDLYVYRYNEPDSGNCFPRTEINSKVIIYNYRTAKHEVPIKIYRRIMTLLESYYGNLQTDTVCEQTVKKQ